jgi:hypothetical protein
MLAGRGMPGKIAANSGAGIDNESREKRCSKGPFIS